MRFVSLRFTKFPRLVGVCVPNSRGSARPLIVSVNLFFLALLFRDSVTRGAYVRGHCARAHVVVAVIR